MATEIASALAAIVERAAGELRSTSPQFVDSTRPSGAWSSREVLGHLIDSAANNHHRFVRIQHTDALDFPPYDQEAWVASQQYADCEWAELIELWVAYNRHLVHVLRVMPDEHLDKPCHVDGTSEPQSMADVAWSYLEHMQHHLNQLIVGDSADEGAEGRPMELVVTLGVGDISRSTDYYQTGLGFTRIPYDSDNISFFVFGDAQLALFGRGALAQDAGVSADGVGFEGITLAWTVDSSSAVIDALDRAVAAGGTLVKNAQPVFWGGFSGYFADPDGHLWEVACSSADYAAESGGRTSEKVGGGSC